MLAWLSIASLGMMACNKDDDPTPPKPHAFTKLSSTVLGGYRGDDFSTSLATADGGYIMLGNTDSDDGDFSGSRQETDAFAFKFNAAGHIEWKKYYGGSEDDNLSGIAVTPDGGYVLTGWSYSTDGDLSSNQGLADYWVIKISSTGDKEWSRTFGGSQYDFPGGVVVAPDGGYLVTGSTQSNDGDVTGQHGSNSNDIWLIKLSSTGHLQWQKTYGGSGQDYNGAILVTADGNYIMTGSTASSDGDLSGITGSAGGYDGWLCKLSPSGSILWNKLYGGSESDYLGNLLSTTDGGYLIGGGSSSNNGPFTGHKGKGDAMLMKVDATGNKQWTKLYGGKEADNLGSFISLSDGTYLLAGTTNSPDGDIKNLLGLNDGWLAQVSAKGDLLWNTTIGGTGHDYLNSLIRTKGGKYIVGGFTQSKDNDLATNQGHEDAWIYIFQ